MPCVDTKRRRNAEGLISYGAAVSEVKPGAVRLYEGSQHRHPMSKVEACQAVTMPIVVNGWVVRHPPSR